METVDSPYGRGRQAIVAAGAALALMLTSCAAPGESGPQAEPVVTAYLPTTTNDQELAALIDNPDLTDPVNQINIAFGLPTETGEVQPPEISDAYKQVVDKNPKSRITLAIGGWSIGGSHAKMMANLGEALSDPDRFANSIVAARDQVAGRLERQPNDIGFSLDLETPTADQTDAVNRTVQKLDAIEPNTTITMAVPPIDSAHTFDFSTLNNYVDGYDFMLYDYATFANVPGVAGYIAPPERVKSDIDEAVAAVSSAKVHVGFPAYGTRYPGADTIGQAYNPAGDGRPTDILFKSVAAQPISPDGLTTVDGALVTVVTPAMVGSTMAEARRRYPDIGGAFVWTWSGTTRDFLAAMAMK